MSNFDKQAVQAVADLKAGYTLGHADVATLNELARIALASLEAEPVAYMYKDNLHADARFSLHTRFGNWSQEDINEYEITEIPLYTAPPAPVSVPDGVLKILLPDAEKSEFWFEHDGKILFEGVKFNNAVFDACRAAMLQGAYGNTPVIPDGWVDMLQRWLVFGRGMQNAGSQLPRNLIAETEAVLAVALQQEVKQ